MRRGGVLGRIVGDAWSCGSSNSSSSSSSISSSYARVRVVATARRGASSSSSQPLSYHEVSEALRTLGVTAATGEDVTPAQLKQRYRELVKRHHPDTGGDAATMSRITVAYNRLSGMSRHEWDAYKRQRRVYSSSSSYNSSSSNSSSGGGVGGSYSVHDGDGRRGAAGAYASACGGEGAAAYRAYAQQRAEQEAFWSFYARHAARYASGAGASSSRRMPFGFSSLRGGAGRVPRGAAYAAAPLPGGVVLRAVMAYLVLSALLLYAYRRYRDAQHDDGWRMAEALARHESMQELYRIRRELNARLREREAAAASNGGGVVVAATTTTANAQDDEARALAYAQRRRQLLQQEQQYLQQQQRQRSREEELLHMRGWPPLREEQGRLYHRASDPLGVVVYEPPRHLSQQMQLRNHLLDQARAREAAAAAAAAGGAASSGDNAGNAATAPPHDAATTATTTNASAPSNAAAAAAATAVARTTPPRV